jgi:uncharacterized protein YcfJ
MNKYQVTAIGLLTLGIAAIARPTLANTTYEEADVLSSTPIYRIVETTTPRRECWEEEVARTERRSRDDSATPEILGAVIGGALGNAVGHHKRNKQVGAVVGAVLGGTIAHDISTNRRADEVVYMDTVERCRTVSQTNQEEKLVGYDVRYSYNGSVQTVRMDSDPGATVRVRVNVEPVL